MIVLFKEDDFSAELLRQLNLPWRIDTMPAKKDHWAEMCAHAEAEIERLQTEMIFSDPPKTEAEQAVLLDSIEAQIAKVERVKAMQLRLKAK